MSLPNSFRFSFRFPVDPSHPQSSVLLDPDAQPEAILRVLRSTAENEQLRGFATIRTLAQVATSEIARYQEEIEKVDGQLERLRTDVDRGPGSAGHNELIATLDKRRLRMLDDHEKLCHLSAVAISIDAPVRRLPTEILGRIFQLCRDDKTAFRDGPHRQELRYLAGGALVPLSQVSSRWRDVVHGTPSFWSDIELDIHLWGDGPVSRDCLKHSYARARRLLKFFLKRAGTMPLTLRIVGDDMCRGEMLRRIAKEAHRWRTASFSLDAEMLGEALPASSDAPLLQSLELEVLSEGGALLQNTLAGFHRIPASCKLRISAPAASLVHFPVPLERIETLTYRCVGWEELPLVLRQMGDLPVGAAVHMEIDFGDLLRNGVEDERMTLPDVVSHIGRLEVSSWTRLRFLGQCADTEISLAAIFRYVSLPNLQSFRVFVSEESTGVTIYKPCPVYWPTQEENGMYFFRGTHLHLQHLSLYDAYVPAEELIKILHSTPALTRLSLSDNPKSPTQITDALLKALTRTDESAHTLVPNLKRLDLRSYGEFKIPSLLELLKSRSTSGVSSSAFACLLLQYPRWRFKFEKLANGPSPLVSIADLVESLEGKLEFTCREFEEEDFELEF